MLVLLVFFAARAIATTDANVDPDGNISVQWHPLPTTPVSNYDKIDDGIRYNNAPDITNRIYCEYVDSSCIDIYNMTSLTGVQSVSAIKVWAYGYTYGGSCTGDISKDGSTWVGAQNFGLPTGGSSAWKSITFDLSASPWTQTNLDALQVKITGNPTMQKTTRFIFMQCMLN